MALTKITGQVINDTTGLVVGVTTVGGGVSAVDGFFSGIVTFSNDVSIAGTLTYEDVTNVNSVGNITVGSGITLSKDGDIFFTGIMTGNGSGLTGVANTDVIFTDKLSLGDANSGGTDGDLIAVGLGSDLKIFHNGTHSIINNSTNTLVLQSDALSITNNAGNSNRVTSHSGGEVKLYYSDSAKLETTNTGVTVTGTVAATSYTGDGSALTGIEAGIQTAVPKSVSGITTVLDLSKDDFKITAAGITTIDVRGGSEGNSHTLRIHNSGITTVGFSTYFLFPSGASPVIPTADGTISLISFTVDRQGAVGLATQLLTGASVNFS